jgi:uncharacterized membrane protein YhaH (DUF805 family)
VDFAGRTPRSGYWWWVLFGILVSIVASILDSILGSGRIINELSGLALLLPGIAVGCRRMHDIGKSGWNLLWSLTIIGIIYVIYLLVQPGTPGPNKYGPDPLGQGTGQPSPSFPPAV